MVKNLAVSRRYGYDPWAGKMFHKSFSVFKIFSIHCEISPQGFCSELVSFS